MNHPLVSVGMPAFNSERTIAEAIECVLTQDLDNFELIVSDNASTDGTWAIIQAFAARDCRVRPLRQAENIGANRNYSAVMQPARGRYFKWASSNDWCEPTFLSRCVACLESRPDVVLAAPRSRLFETDFASGQLYSGDRPFDDPDPVRRFAEVSMTMQLNNVLNGVIRSDALRSTKLMQHFRGADIVLVGQLAVLGKIVLLDEPLFGRRMDPRTATHLMSAEAVERHHHPRRTLRALLPYWRYVLGWARAAQTSPLPLDAKLRALRHVVRMIYWGRGRLGRDVFDALRSVLQHRHG